MSDREDHVKVKIVDLSRRPGCIHRLLIRLVINAAALYLAAQVISGIHLEGLKSIIVVAVIFGLVNAFIKPVLWLVAYFGANHPAFRSKSSTLSDEIIHSVGANHPPR